jgi:hypothetical protein
VYVCVVCGVCVCMYVCGVCVCVCMCVVCVCVCMCGVCVCVFVNQYHVNVSIISLQNNSFSDSSEAVPHNYIYLVTTQ